MVSCGIPGTIASEMLPGGAHPFGHSYKIRIGHPSGTMGLKARLTRDEGNAITVHSAIVGRTARVLMEGVAFVREAQCP